MTTLWTIDENAPENDFEYHLRKVFELSLSTLLTIHYRSLKKIIGEKVENRKLEKEKGFS